MANSTIPAPSVQRDTGKPEPLSKFIQGMVEVDREFREMRDRCRPAARPEPKPVPMPEWSWLLRPTNGRGYLVIAQTTYQVTEQQFEFHNGMGGRLWDLMKSDGTTYRITLNHDDDLVCDCPDSTYRNHTCKHALALQAAFNELNRLARLDAWLAAMEPVPADCPF